MPFSSRNRLGTVQDHFSNRPLADSHWPGQGELILGPVDTEVNQLSQAVGRPVSGVAEDAGAVD